MAIKPQSWLTSLTQQALSTGKALSPAQTSGIRAGQIAGLYNMAGGQQALQQQLDQINQQNAYWSGQLGLGKQQNAAMQAYYEQQGAQMAEQMAMQEAAAAEAKRQYELQYAQQQEKIKNDKIAADRAAAAAKDAASSQAQSSAVSGGVGALGATANLYKLAKDSGWIGGGKGLPTPGSPEAQQAIDNAVQTLNVGDKAYGGALYPNELPGVGTSTSQMGSAPVAVAPEGFTPGQIAMAPNAPMQGSYAAPMAQGGLPTPTIVQPATDQAALTGAVPRGVEGITPQPVYSTPPAPPAGAPVGGAEFIPQAVEPSYTPNAGVFGASPGSMASGLTSTAPLSSTAADVIGGGAIPAYLAADAAPVVAGSLPMGVSAASPMATGITGSVPLSSGAAELIGGGSAAAGGGAALGGAAAGQGAAYASMAAMPASAWLGPIGAAITAGLAIYGSRQHPTLEKEQALSSIGANMDYLNRASEMYGAGQGANARTNLKAYLDANPHGPAMNEGGGMGSAQDALDTTIRFANSGNLQPDQFKQLWRRYSPEQMSFFANLYNSDPNLKENPNISAATQQLQNYGGFFNDKNAPWNNPDQSTWTPENMASYWGGGGYTNPAQAAPTGGVYDQVSGIGSQLLGRNWQFPSDWPTGLTADQYTNMIRGSSEFLNRQNAGGGQQAQQALQTNLADQNV